MNAEEITKKIAKDTGSSGAVARSMAERILKLHDDLLPAVNAYIAGESVSFALGSITLQTIMQKEHCSIVEALFSMNTLLENPELAAKYKSLSFRTGCLEE
jgi:hypothetical protein